ASIWHALHHYAYSDAVFLAERLFAEVGSDDALHLLASCYYQAGQIKRAYSLLQTNGCPTPLCRILFAKCCITNLHRLAEGEMVLAGGCLFTNGKPIETIAAEFGTSAGYALSILGQICRKSDQSKRAAECFKSSLRHNPFLWTSFEALCNLGEKPDEMEYFKSSSCTKILSSLMQRETMTTGIATSTMATNPAADSQQQPIKCMAENLDPSSNNTPLPIGNFSFDQAGNNTPGSDSGFLIPPTPMSLISENRVRARVGRNLLGATQTSSPLSPSFGILPCDTPVDQNTVPFITPSPAVLGGTDMHSGNTPKAPLKKGVRRSDTTSTRSTVVSTVHTTSAPSQILTRASPSHPSVSQSLFPSSTTNKTVRRSTRLFTMSSNSSGENRVPVSICFLTALANGDKPTRTSITQDSLGEFDVRFLLSTSLIAEWFKRMLKVILRKAIFDGVSDGLMALLRHIGQAYRQLCGYESREALLLFSTLPTHHYNTTWVLSQVGRAHFELAEYQLAEKVFSQVQHLDPSRLEGMEIYSTILWHLQKEVELSSLAHHLVEVDRSSPEAWCATGNCFSLQKEHDTAIKFFQRAVQVDQACTYAYTLLGHEYVLTEELDRAMSCYRMAIRSDPRHYNAWYGVGMIYYKQEKFNLAEVHFRKALSINPSSSVLYCHVGVVQHAMRKSEAALATINKAMLIDPKNPLCKFHRASILFSIDKYQEALHELEDLKKIVPREALVYFLIGKVYKKLGQAHLAQMNFSWAIDLDPKGANNQIKDAIDKRYLPDDDD
ncbi:predicted protein, partial [Nematostella vectensis]